MTKFIKKIEPMQLVRVLPITDNAQVNSRKNVLNKYFIGIAILLLTSLFIFLFLTAEQITALQQFLKKDHYLFYWMLLVGFTAEIVAGSMGMGYGVICTSILLMLNVPPPVISASIHTAESFTSAAGSFSHWHLGNINKKLGRALAIPAAIGAVIGALTLSVVGEKYALITKPLIACYSLYLGLIILKNAFRQKATRVIKQPANIKRLGFAGGFIDSFGGGGWGPLITGTLIKNGRAPRFVIGSSTFAKCILTVASAITFIFTIGIHHWHIVAGLLIGGIITAPFSAMLTTRLSRQKMFFAIGLLIIGISSFTIIKSVLKLFL
jgi:uncharacterized membrane protein YfcA